MNQQEAKALIEKVHTFTDTCLKAKGELIPMLHYERGDGKEVVAICPMSDDKTAWAGAIRYLLSEDEAKWVLFITEAWVASVDKDELPITTRVKDHPNRMEAVVFQLEYAGGLVHARAEIKRDAEGKPSLAPVIFDDVTDVYGNFGGLLPKPKERTLQ